MALLLAFNRRSSVGLEPAVVGQVGAQGRRSGPLSHPRRRRGRRIIRPAARTVVEAGSAALRQSRQIIQVQLRLACVRRTQDILQKEEFFLAGAATPRQSRYPTTVGRLRRRCGRVVIGSRPVKNQVKSATADEPRCAQRLVVDDPDVASGRVRIDVS